MSEPLILVAFLERLAARPIPQLTMGDKDRLHEASQELRKLAERQRRKASERGRITRRSQPLKADRAGLELEGEAP